MTTPFYKKMCHAEDAWLEVKPGLQKLQESMDRLLTIAIDNRGEPDTPYDEIAADHILQHREGINNLPNYKYTAPAT